VLGVDLLKINRDDESGRNIRLLASFLSLKMGDHNGNLERFDARHLRSKAGHGSGDAQATKAH
jgi:hypothetical protein